MVTFGDKLNEYMKYLKCSPKELVAFSGVSSATISRYRSGARVPSINSSQLVNIISGLVKAAQEIGRTDITYEKLTNEFSSVINSNSNTPDLSGFRINLNLLISTMHLNAKDIARFLGFDYSHIFRIRTGQRKPSDLMQFSRLIGDYVSSKRGDEISRDILADLLGCTSAELEDENTVREKIAGWLCNYSDTPRRYARDFLIKLDKFDLEKYIDRMSISIVSKNDSLYDSQKVFTGKDCFRNAGNIFLSAADNSFSSDPALICTDIYSEKSNVVDHAFLDIEYIIARLLQKGLRVKLILNADNPIDEILPGLETLMPVFMTGQLEAYYLKGRRDNVYRYTLISLGDMALSGEAIADHHESAMFRFSRKDEEVCYYRKRAEQILALADPLMEIIDNDIAKRSAMLSIDAKKQGFRHSVLSTPPIYTISDKLLESILSRNNVNKEESEQIRHYIHSERSRVLKILKHSEIEDHIPDISEEQFRANPIFLSLSGLFYSREIFYNYKEYLEHMELTKKFTKSHPGYRIKSDKNSIFRNIQIFMNEDQWVMLSKNRTPAIHLFIKHPRLRKSIENMLMIYSE